jgi:hypothetical protein
LILNDYFWWMKKRERRILAFFVCKSEGCGDIISVPYRQLRKTSKSTGSLLLPYRQLRKAARTSASNGLCSAVQAA